MYHLSKDQISVAINPITTWDLIYPRSEQTGHPHPVQDTWVIPTNQPLLKCTSSPISTCKMRYCSKKDTLYTYFMNAKLKYIHGTRVYNYTIFVYEHKAYQNSKNKTFPEWPSPSRYTIFFGPPRCTRNK